MQLEHGFYRLQCETVQAHYELTPNGDIYREVTYNQSFSVIAHYTEFDLID
jgi:hypothetical protein